MHLSQHLRECRNMIHSLPWVDSKRRIIIPCPGWIASVELYSLPLVDSKRPIIFVDQGG